MIEWKQAQFVCDNDKRIWIWTQMNIGNASLANAAKIQKDAEKYAERSAFIVNGFIRRMISQSKHYKAI